MGAIRPQSGETLGAVNWVIAVRSVPAPSSLAVEEYSETVGALPKQEPHPSGPGHPKPPKIDSRKA